MGKYLSWKQLFIIWVRSGTIISEVPWYISALIPSGSKALFGLSIFIYLFISSNEINSMALFSAVGSLFVVYLPQLPRYPLGISFLFVCRFLPTNIHRSAHFLDGGYDVFSLLYHYSVGVAPWTCSCFPLRLFSTYSLWQSVIVFL